MLDFSPLCVFKCVLKVLASEDAYSHWLQLLGLSPLCTFIFLNDCLFPTATQLRSGGRWLAGEGGQVVDVLMGVDEAALHHIVVSLLCILLVIEEEEVSCLVGVGEVDVQNHDGEDGEGSGHVLLGENTRLPL